MFFAFFSVCVCVGRGGGCCLEAFDRVRKKNLENETLFERLKLYSFLN